ncbi:galactose-1-phosphate uridylyltransferase [Promethearchaeum syntrophicum]|uniref:Galactose-1-phosphate uridylyltransferase n=1 Tax=Promethearchaeum syntrophicum TaxID=2594042 RepID=A0A5B9D6M5_9ARCH|nr:galactose-1-phosphate uridylyltransferase [Candidatus Prometheoarchaeum syntrophicum]QEE14626.1 galactose-1-phosphate uridylyltransferase [Candidatus Prometheoarchaeum syntrophicum]
MLDEKSDKSQYRWDPFQKEWIIYAPKRNLRPFQGKNFKKEPKKTWTCPFCPDAPEGSGKWVVKQLPNRFASLDETKHFSIEKIMGSFKKTAPNYGKCEVILYSQDHDASFGTLEHQNIIALIKMWQERFAAIKNMKDMKYIFIMENRGKEIGNSMTHPHGQIFSFPFIPPKIEKEYLAFKQYNKEKNSCILCDILKEEQNEKNELKNGGNSRIVCENDDFLAIIPYYAHWAFEIHIISKRHFRSLIEITETEIESLAQIMKKIVQKYDALHGDGNIMPYVMAMHNSPVNTKENSENLFHFHIEYYTPFRGKEKLKFLAGVELGTGTMICDALPELNAKIMRELST